MRKLSNLIQAAIFYAGVKFTKLKGLWKPFSKQHKKVKITQVALKAGDTYRLGECIVTLATFGVEGKKEVSAKLAKWEEIRQQKEQAITDKGIQIMLMKPEELEQFQINEWMKQRKAFNEKKYYENLK
jgi:hypothetical protein